MNLAALSSTEPLKPLWEVVEKGTDYSVPSPKPLIHLGASGVDRAVFPFSTTS